MPATSSEPLSLEERKRALEKALTSRTFARSDQLKAFLRFVCEADTLRPGAPLNEYIIGVEVLGRPEGYSPAEDSSVRTRAYELRQKLERLYAGELCEEEVRISIPRGTYSPQFIRNHPASTEIELHSFTPPPARQPVTASPRLRLVSMLVIGVLFGALLTWLLAVRRPTPIEPILADAWGPIGKPGGDVLLVAATPLALIAGPRHHATFGSPEYPAPAEAYGIFRLHRPLAPSSELGLNFSDNMLAVGNVSAILTSASTLRNFGATYQLLPERVASISALRGRNALMFGAPVDSEAISLALQDFPLSVEFDSDLREFVVIDRNTHRSFVPRKKPDGSFQDVYGLITVKDDDGPDHRPVRTVVFSGITSVGTQGATEFFSSPASMSLFFERLRRQGIKRFPSSYQIVVRCTYNNQLLRSYFYTDHRVP